ncbi:hypothetical protein DFH09DRAFT_1076990 [Mycena vulgaris]|nr:hypothetical protein DFH09DRAFT_1076990 [Mycena vulgaris]
MAAPPVVPSRPSFRRPSAHRTVPLPSRQEKFLAPDGTGRLPVTGTRQTVATGTAHSPKKGIIYEGYAWATGRHACNTARNDKRGGERGMWRGITSGSAVCVSVGWAVKRRVPSWRHGVPAISLVMTRAAENDAYGGGALATVRAVDHSRSRPRWRARHTGGVWHRVVNAAGVLAPVGCAQVERCGDSGNAGEQCGSSFTGHAGVAGGAKEGGFALIPHPQAVWLRG